MKKSKIFGEFIFWGRELYKKDLVSATSGNLGLKVGRNIFITRSGCLLGLLKPGDIIKVALNKICPADKAASSELPAHRAILCRLPYQAVMHAHPAYTIALSLKSKNIVPLDLEGKYYFPRVEIIETELKPAARELPEKLLAALKKSKLVVVRGHGVFAAGNNFKEAFCLISALEASARISLLATA